MLSARPPKGTSRKFPEELSNLIMQCLQRGPHLRPTHQEVQAKLAKLYRNLGAREKSYIHYSNYMYKAQKVGSVATFNYVFYIIILLLY